MADHASQTELIEGQLLRLQQGEFDAVNQLLEHAGLRLQHLARKMLAGFGAVRRHEQTDDVLQNALLRLTRALHESVPDDARHFFRLAALQIRRELIDLSRRYNGKGALSLDADRDDQRSGVGDALAPSEHTNDPRRVAEWTEFHRLVQELPEKEREVVDLLLYNGLSQQEAAETMQVDVRSIKRYWQRARISLFEALQGSPTSPVNLLMN
ncbi:MAG: sigma-70 family RNA polymerase sigma factor [Planctomycetaceae bacterium]|nr:sigma-70 family RNA polymerase sigma factor [Planctomycetaceae bacterium]